MIAQNQNKTTCTFTFKFKLSEIMTYNQHATPQQQSINQSKIRLTKPHTWQWRSRYPSATSRVANPASRSDTGLLGGCKL